MVCGVVARAHKTQQRTQRTTSSTIKVSRQADNQAGMRSVGRWQEGGAGRIKGRHARQAGYKTYIYIYIIFINLITIIIIIM